MTDNYLSFNFKNANYNPTTKYSLYTHFGGFVINEGTDLTFFNPSSFSHEFVNPKFGNQSYFTGTTRENREFTFNIILKDRTLAQYKEFLRWLNPHDSGILYFDYNPYWGYNVKVNSIGEGKFTVTPNCGATLTYSIEVEVGFITVNEWAATLITSPAAIPLSTIGLPTPNPSSFYEYGTTNNLFEIKQDFSNIIFDTVTFATTENISLDGTVSEIDGVSIVNGNIILVKNQDDESQNGIYIIEGGDWFRSSNYNEVSEIENMPIIKVLDGNINSNTYWKYIDQGLMVIGIDPIEFEQYILISFTNNCNLEAYLKFTGTSITSLSIKDSSGLITYYSYSGTAITFTLYTEYGVAIDNSNNFIALNNNLGQLTIQPGETKILNITYTGTSLTVVPILREVI